MSVRPKHSKEESDDVRMLAAILEKRPPVQDIITAYNQFVSDLPKLLASFPIYYRRDNKEKAALTFIVTDPLPATYSTESGELPLYAATAVKNRLSFQSKLFVVPQITLISQPGSPVIIPPRDPQEMFSIPVMKGSILDPGMKILNKEDKSKYGEVTEDPGGWFIYKGTRSFIPCVEKLRIDQIHIMAPNNKFKYLHARQTVSVPSGTAVIKVCYFEKWGTCGITTSLMKHPSDNEVSERRNEIYFTTDVNYIGVFHMIKILHHLYDGPNESFKENPIGYAQTLISELCDDKYRNVVLAKLDLSYKHYLDVDASTSLRSLIEWLSGTKESQEKYTEKVARYIKDHIFPNEQGVVNKIHMICFLTWRLLSNVCGVPGHDIVLMNDWGYKRLDPASVSLSQILRKACNSMVQKIMSIKGEDAVYTDAEIISLVYSRSRMISDELLRPFEGNSAKNNGVRKGFELAETVNATNLTDFYAQMTKANVKIDRGIKKREVRAVQETQGSLICPADTPDDNKCGIVKHLAITARITLSVNLELKEMVEKLYAADIISNVRDPSRMRVHPIQINASFIIGWCNGPEAHRVLTEMRRGSPGKCDADLINGQIVVRSMVPGMSKACEDVLNRWRTPGTEGYPVYFEGVYMYHADASLVNIIRRWSRNLNTIPRETCITFRPTDTLEIYYDAGRLVRPVYVAERFFTPDGSYKDEVLIDRYGARNWSVTHLENNGFIDYTDSYEETSDLIIVKYSIADLKTDSEDTQRMEKEIVLMKDRLVSLLDEQSSNPSEGLSKQIKHCNDIIDVDMATLDNRRIQRVSYVGIHGITKYGVSVANAAYVNFNPSSRNTFASKTTKQTLVTMLFWHEHKAGIYSLSTSTPVVDTPSISEVFGTNVYVQARPAMFAVLPLGYNQEDALVMSKDYAQDNISVYAFTHSVDIDVSNNLFKDTMIHPRLVTNKKKISDLNRFRFIQSNGLPMIGAELEPGDCVISLFREYTANKSKKIDNKSVFMKVGEYGIVTDITLVPLVKGKGKSTSIVRYSVLLHDFSTINTGDKMSTYQGQKATAVVVSSIDLPWSIHGYVPSVFINPHAFPTRMTTALPVESILGKAAAIKGELFRGTSFEVPPEKLARKILYDHGFAPSGTETFNDGRTGRTYQTQVFVGVVQLQELLHKAEHKLQARGLSGITHTITRQGEKGKGSASSVRIGEMERDAIIAYTAVLYAVERFKTLSDKHVMYICSICYGALNVNSADCPYCRSEDSVINADTTFAYRLLTLLLAGLSINAYSRALPLMTHFAKLVDGAVGTGEAELVDGADYVSDEDERHQSEEVHLTDDEDEYSGDI